MLLYLFSLSLLQFVEERSEGQLQCKVVWGENLTALHTNVCNPTTSIQVLETETPLNLTHDHTDTLRMT